MSIGSFPYVGRFAPSPSGNLHFGSLVTALASYLQAKTQQGFWWLRLDDLDTPRNVAGADSAIQYCLEAHAMQWDGFYRQSEHLEDYQSYLQQLTKQRAVFACDCTRKQVMAAGGTYPGTCRNRDLSRDEVALRFCNNHELGQIQDVLHGTIISRSDAVQDDFILRRRDGIYGYHLASVTDDIKMGVTEIVRGADLILPSICQTFLFRELGCNTPAMLHIPVACGQPGKKLSKQNHAPELDSSSAAENLYQALLYLGQQPLAELKKEAPTKIIDWALDNWSIQSIPVKTEIII